MIQMYVCLYNNKFTAQEGTLLTGMVDVILLHLHRELDRRSQAVEVRLLEQEGLVSTELGRRLKPNASLPPKLYGLHMAVYKICIHHLMLYKHRND